MAATPVAAPRRKRWCGRSECRPDTRMVETGDDLTPVPCRLCHPRHVGMADSGPAKSSNRRRHAVKVSRRPSQTRLDAQQRDPRWCADAAKVIEVLASEDRPFTSDDMRQERFGLGEPATSSAWGAVFGVARSAGLIRKVGYRPSSVASRHGGAVATWIGTGRREP